MPGPRHEDLSGQTLLPRAAVVPDRTGELLHNDGVLESQGDAEPGGPEQTVAAPYRNCHLFYAHSKFTYTLRSGGFRQARNSRVTDSGALAFANQAQSD